jgi:hypothetical protein
MQAVCSLWHFPSNRLKPAVPDVIRHTALRSSDFPPVLRRATGSHSDFAYGGVTLYAETFQVSSAIQMISYSLPDQQLRLVGPSTPVTQRLLAITRNRFLIPSF